MASSDAGLANLVVAKYSGNTYTSLALNGNSWISTAVQANTALTNQNFTIEFWVNFTDYSANSNRSVYNNYTSAFAANNIYIGKHTTSNGNLSAWFGSISTTTFSVQESGTPPAGWNHYAVTRNGANVTLFRNGIIQASNTSFSTTAITNTTNFDQIGGNAAGSANLIGSISGLRILKSQALYTANFTTSTSQFTAIANTVLLTAQTSSSNIYTTFIDTSSSATTITNANASYILSTPLFNTGNITTTPTFATANLTYNVNVTSNITAISITPTANDAANASIKVNNVVTLSGSTSSLILLNTTINSNTNTVANTIANTLVTAGDAVTTNTYSVTIATTAPNLYSNIVNTEYKGANSALASSYVTNGIVDSANILLAESLANANSLANSSSFTTTTFVSSDAGSYINTGLTKIGLSNASLFIGDIANSNLAETLSNANISSANYTRSTDSIASLNNGFTIALSNTTLFIGDIANSNLAETLSNANIGTASALRQYADSGFTGIYTPTPVGGIIYFPTYSYTDGVVITAANVQNNTGSGSFATNTQIWYQG
jgi:hypothetical protein